MKFCQDKKKNVFDKKLKQKVRNKFLLDKNFGFIPGGLGQAL